MDSRLVWLLVGVLLAGFMALGVTSNLESCNTYDEPAHIGNGASFWLTHDHRMAPEAILLQLWLSLPVALGDYEYPSLDQPEWWQSDNITLADQYFFRMGNDAQAMLLAGRAMNLALALVLGLVVFAWSRRLFGAAGGLLSLAVHCFCPTILAHGSLATPDMGTALFFTLSLAALWNVLHRLTPWSVLGSTLAVSGLFLCKMSAVLIIPTGLLLLIVRIVSKQPLTLALGSRSWQIVSRPAQAAAFAVLIIVHVLVCWVGIWAVFGFRYEMFRESVPGRDNMYAGSWEATLANVGGVAGVIDYARYRRLLPEAYLYAFANTLRFSQSRLAFMNGQLSFVGWPEFFPFCFLVKTPLPTLLLLLLATVAWAGRWLPDKESRWQKLAGSLYRSAPLWIFVVVYWAVALRSRINIGHRHILPIYPMVFIWIGANAGWLRWQNLRGRIAAAATLLCLAWLAGESLYRWPHYLAYFNQVTRGPAQGYRHLVDGSLDWGQDLIRLRSWLLENRTDDTTAYLAYYGTANLDYYGMSPPFVRPLLRIATTPAAPITLEPGLYCISASTLQLQGAMFSMPYGQWNAELEKGYQGLAKVVEEYRRADQAAREKLLQRTQQSTWGEVFWLFEQTRVGRLCAFLREREPDHQIGHSILIYRLTQKDLDQPPAF